MNLLKSSPVKSLILLMILFLGTFNGVAQTADPNHIPGTFCTSCPAPPKYAPPTIMNGNNANVTSYTASACGLSYVYASVKLMKRGPGGGVTQPAPLVISGLPGGCANILKAFLYADASGNGIAVTATVTNPSLVPTAYPMTIIGNAPDKCWSYSGSYSYRADITTCITGNGTYSISGLPTNPPTAGNDCDGATLLIIYSDPSQTYTGHLTIADGAHVAAPGTITNTISIPAACANSTFAEGMILVADFQSIGNAPMRMNSATNNFTLAPALQVYWNFVTSPVPAVTAGQTTSIFGVGPSSGDCFNVVMSALYYRTTCNTCTFSPSTMSITAASSPSCSTGTGTANVSGGTGPYTYSWNPTGATTQTVSGAPGVYTCTVKDANCGLITTTVNLTALAPVTLNITTNQPSCINPAGTSTAIVGGGATASGFTVSWSPSPGTVTPTGNGSIASGLSPGTTTVTVVDASGCTTNSTFTVGGTAMTNFSLTASGTATLTCINPSVAIIAVNSTTLGNMTYTWMPGSVNGATYNATSTGIYTVTGQDLVAGSCPLTQTFAVSQNTTVPSMSVNPVTTQTLSCNGACKSFTATTTTTTNIIGTWDGPSGQIVPPTGTPMILCANAPGTYTANFCNTITGCCASTTVAVVSSTTVPTLSVTVSTTNGFTINCTNPKVIMNTNSSGTCAPIGYTWTPLANPSASVMPVAGGYTATIPGQYEVTFHDCNLCYVTTTISVFIDTLRPSPFSNTNLPSNSYTINCFNPTLIATGITTPLLPPTSYSWTQPGPLTISSNTTLISMGLIPGPSGSTVTYTVAAMGPNGCVGKQKVIFTKDTYTPSYIPVSTPSIGITCYNPCVAISPSGTSTVPVTFTFTSPAPTQTATTSGALMCVPGTYTMNYINQLNGCPGTSTANIAVNVSPPAIVPLPNVTIPCGQITAVITAGVFTTSPTYSYSWTGPPGSGMSCIGGTACISPSVNMPGYYEVSILNTANGCISTNSVIVEYGALNVGFTADPNSGFAPLNVIFTNTSQLGSSTSGTVYTSWSYGNGITYTSTATSASIATGGLPGGSTIYQSAGSYTVVLYMQQITGQPLPPGFPPNYCTGTATLVINVELPSQLTIPNVFTPNGDGVNDVFFLQTTNLTEINCLIYDRWGVKMYETTSVKGNIAWDGKNLSNKEVPDGTYFYIIKATGLDDKEYEYKGTISLFR